MSRPPRARERVMSAFEDILITQGERAATLEAVAREAEVSKGGLLYHFASKDALEQGLLERLEELVAADVQATITSPTGPIDYYLRTSLLTNDPLDRAIIAVSRLAQGGSTTAADALRRMREQWAESIRPATRNRAALDLVILVGEGLYFANTLPGGGVSEATTPGPAMDNLIALVTAVASADTEPS